MLNKKLILVMVLGVFFLSFGSAALTDNIESYYKLDEGAGPTGTVFDAVGNNDATNVGATNTTGKIFSAYLFDGSTTSIDLNNYFSQDIGSGAFTVNFWYYENGSTSGNVIHDYASPRGFYMNKDRLNLFDNSANPSVQLVTSPSVGWHMITGIRNSTGLYIYYDGTLDNSNLVASGSIAQTTNNARLGRSSHIASAYFNSKIDEVGIWLRDLTPTEVSQLYNSNAGLQYPFTVGPQYNLSIEFVTPPTPVNYYNLTEDYFVVEVDVNSTNVTFENITYSLRNVNGTHYNVTFTNETYSYNFTNIPEAHYRYDVQVCGEENITNTTICETTETRHINHDVTPPEITITSPVSKYEYLTIGQLLDLNFTAIDAQANLSECSWNYNGTNYSIPCTNATLVNTQFAQELNNFNITVYANDTFGNLGSESKTWSYQFLETNRTFNENALQTGIQSFVLTGIRDASITSTTAVFHYNGDEYTAIKTGTGNNVIFSNTIGIPTDLEGSVEFYWTVTYTNSTGTYSFNTTSSNQTVYALSLEECFSPTIDGLTLNFTVYDTTNMTTLPATFEATFQFYAESGSGDLIVEYLFQDLNENRSNYMFCLNSSGQNVTLDAFISYDATNYDRREYIIDDGIIGNFTQNIPLYLTETELTDIVTVTVQDQNYDPIAGALVNIQEWNIGTNTYSTIGMLTTSSSGQGIIDLELYTTWYRAVVSINGEIVKVTDVEKLSSTSWPITIETAATNPYDLFGSVAHGLTFDNATNITSFTWVDSSGYTSQGCLVIKNQTSLGPVKIYDSCIESVSGTIDYLLSGTGEYNIYGVIFLEGYNQSQIVDELTVRLGTPEIIETVSPFGKVISFIMVGTAGLIGVSAGSIVLGSFLVILMLAVIMYFGFLNITSGIVWGIVSILIIAIFLQRRKR